MPDSNSRRDTEFAKYDTMSTEELQQILRKDASKSEGEESDTEALFYVMEVLAMRRRARNEGKTPEEALESFKKNYLEENDASEAETVPTVKKRGPGFRRWMRGLVAAAAMLVLIVGSSFTARAFGFDLWNVIVKWTQETFHFGYITDTSEPDGPNSESENILLGLQGALKQYNVSVSLIPAWLPEGYQEMDVSIEETPVQRRFIAKYQSGDQTIRIRVVDFLNINPTQIEQSDSLIEVYSSGNIDYYIFDNEGQLQAMWINENYECFISGPLTLLEFKDIIDSIGKG